MALPDRFEQAGIVVGSVVLLALPTSALVSVLYGLSVDPWWAMASWLLPGLVIGIALAAGRLPVSYGQVWSFSLVSWLLTVAGWAALGLSLPATNRPLALAAWVGAVAVGAIVARVRPVRRWRRR